MTADLSRPTDPVAGRPMHLPATGSHRRITFVPSAADVATAGDAGDDDLVIVLDTAWTPDPGTNPHALTLRPAFAEALEQHDLYREALVAIDRWADAADLVDRLIVEDVTYWYRAREPMWHWTHERLLWRYALAASGIDDPAAAVRVPWEEDALIDVLRALGQAVEVEGAPAITAPTVAPVGPGPGGSAAGALRSVVRRAARRVGVARESSEATERRRRDAVLDARIARLSDRATPLVVVLTLPSSYQQIGPHEGDRRDPNLGPVIERLVADDAEPLVIGVGMQRGGPDDWAAIEGDPRLLPAYHLQTRWSRPEDEQRVAAALTSLDGRLAGLEDVPLHLAGADLAPAFVAALRASIGRIIRADIHQRARIERLFEDLHPDALLMTQEGHRTAWLAAGQRTGVRTYALQHGVLYPSHAGYPDRRHPSVVLPTRTFVFGDYERRVLEAGAYLPDEVTVVGSPRIDLADGAANAADLDVERMEVRRRLGVADGDRLLVVSTVHTPFVRRSHLAHMLERCLGGPLPGIHIVFKQHPGERDAGDYQRLLIGLARAGGYAPPAMSQVKFIDLYTLLRAADAHLGLNSTVLTDAVVAGTGNLIALIEPDIDLIGYVAAGVALPIRNVDDLRLAMADPRPPDEDARRAFLAEHFRPGDASTRIVDTILADVRRHAATGAGGPS